ncbi:MAG: PrgI family protein [Chloroflexi bacterium]|nr:PrgI family protein [Chloroflexota bacterium]
MPRRRHEIPTHLNVEDKAFVGLSVRQLMNLIVGLSTAYAIWNDWPAMPVLLRGGLAGACLLTAVVLTLVRPGGRPLEEWAFVALHYVATPKLSVWSPREPDPAEWLPGPGSWEELDARVSWRPTATDVDERRDEK